MSKWTHISGAVRLDCFDHKPDNEEKIRNILGKPSTFKEPIDDCKLPEGSEGSIGYEINYTGYCEVEENFTSSSADWGVVTFHGDLRDYDSVDDIYEWAKEIYKELNKYKNGFSVRQFNILISLGYPESQYIIYACEWNHDTKLILKQLTPNHIKK